MRLTSLFMVGFAVLTGPIAQAQAQQLPRTSASEGKVQSLNAAMGREQRRLGTAEQNQFEANQVQQHRTDRSVSGVGSAQIGRAPGSAHLGAGAAQVRAPGSIR